MDIIIAVTSLNNANEKLTQTILHFLQPIIAATSLISSKFHKLSNLIAEGENRYFSKTE